MNYKTMTNEELKKAHKEIEESIYETVASIFGIITLAQINVREAIEKELIERGLA